MAAGSSDPTGFLQFFDTQLGVLLLNPQITATDPTVIHQFVRKIGTSSKIYPTLILSPNLEGQRSTGDQNPQSLSNPYLYSLILSPNLEATHVAESLRLPRGRLRRLAAGSPPPAVHRNSATADTSSPPPADQRDRKSASGRARLLNLGEALGTELYNLVHSCSFRNCSY
jgi:hypothetical protein